MGIQRPDWLTNDVFPFESCSLDILGQHIHYVDEGNGTPILFVHGNPTWSFQYRNVMKGLRDRFRCVAMDLPGFGLSKANSDFRFTPPEHASVLAEFVRALDLNNAIMFFQDWGGPIGLTVAEAMPERFRGLVIGNTWAWSIVGNKSDERFSKILGSSLAKFLNRQTNFFLRLCLSQGIKKSKLDPVARQAYFHPFREKKARDVSITFARNILDAADFLQEVEDNANKVNGLPTLILWPTADFAFTDRHRKRLEKMFPNHKSVDLEGCGHFFAEDGPQETLAEVEAWLATSLRPSK